MATHAGYEIPLKWEAEARTLRRLLARQDKRTAIAANEENRRRREWPADGPRVGCGLTDYVRRRTAIAQPASPRPSMKAMLGSGTALITRVSSPT
jgi:hypothetical protein